MRALTIAAFSVTMIVSSAAGARPSARLVHERDRAAESCPDAEAIARAVNERLGYRALRDDAEGTVALRFSREGEHFSARVSEHDARGVLFGERALEDDGATCVELAGAAVLTISVLLESTDLGRREPGKVEGAAPAPAPEQPSAADPPASTKVEPRIRAGAAASFGVAPDVAPGFLLGAGVLVRSFSVDLEGRIDLPAEDSFAAGRAKTSLRMAQLVPCKRVSIFAGCAVFGAGLLLAEGVGVLNARSRTAFHSTAGLRVAVEKALGAGIFATAHGEAVVALTRTVVAVGGEDLWETPPLGASVGAGLGYAFK